MSSESEDFDLDDNVEEEKAPENSADEMDIASSNDLTDADYQGNWNLLPSIPLQMIYSYVNRKDQTNMSLVCKNWKAEFDAPLNWRRIRFHFPEKPYSDDIFPIVKFARRYAPFIRHLEIICRCTSTAFLRASTDQFDLFVDAIHENANLNSITFFNLKSFVRWLDNEWRARIVDLFKKIFRFQKSIKSVEFKNCSLTHAETVSIFTSMFIEGTSPIQSLKLKKMVSDRRLDEDVDFFQQDWESFRPLIPKMLRTLETWESEYADFVEFIVRQFADMTREELSEYTIGNFKKMILWWEGWDFGQVRGISPEAWKTFHKSFPELTIEFAIGPTSDPASATQILLQKYMPLRSLLFRPTTRLVNVEDFSTTDFFNHLLANNFNETLEDLHIVWMAASATFVSELDNFVRYCPKLKTIEVQVLYPLLDLENLFDSWIRDCPRAIEAVSITVCNIPNEEAYEQLYSLADNFVPILQVMGINILLVLDLPMFQ